MTAHHRPDLPAGPRGKPRRGRLSPQSASGPSGGAAKPLPSTCWRRWARRATAAAPGSRRTRRALQRRWTAGACCARLATGLRCRGALRGALADGARDRAPARRPAEERRAAAGRLTAELLAEAAACATLLQAWQAPRKRLPAAARCAFAGRLEDRLLDSGDSLAAGTCAPCAAPAGFHSSDSGKKIPVTRLKDRLVLPALKQALQPRASRGGKPTSKTWRRGAGPMALASSMRTIGSIWRALGTSPGGAAATGSRDGRPRVDEGPARPQPWAISSSASANVVSSARSRASIDGRLSTSSPTRRASSTWA